MAAPAKRVFEVFVTRVPWTVASKEMKEYFGQFGQIKRCLLPFDKDTGFHKGFCWIGYASEEGLNNALQKEPHILEGAKPSGLQAVPQTWATVIKKAASPSRSRGTDVRLQTRGQKKKVF